MSKRGRWARNLPNPHRDTVGKLRKGSSIVPPLPLLVPIISCHSNRDAIAQTEEVLGFSLALKQLQEITQTKAQLEQRLALELEGLAKNYEVQWEGLAKRYEYQQFRMFQGQEDQWTRMAEQMDAPFTEVLSQVSQADLMRLLPWFLSATAKSGADPTCSVSKALTSITTSEL